MQTIPLYHRLFLFCIFAFAVTFRAEAQKCSFFEVNYKDSLVTSDESSTLINNIKIKNPQRKTIRLGVIITIPKNWKKLSANNVQTENEYYFNLPPGQSKNIPLSLLKLPKAKAVWDSVKIAVWVKNVTDTFFYYSRIQAKATPKFVASALTEDLELAKKTRHLPLSIRLKNTGNVNETYTLRWENRLMEVDEKILVTLPPDKDTDYNFNLKIPAGSWKDLNTEDVLLSITGEGNKSFHHSFNLTRPRPSIKLARSAYEQVPIIFSAGVSSIDSNTFFFGALSGRIHFADQHELSFAYKSKQFGNEVYDVQQHMYLIDYTYKNWNVSAGTIQPLQNFFANNGRGISVKHTLPGAKTFTITAIPKDPNFYYSSNNVAVSAIYPFRGYRLKQMLVADFNEMTGLNGYVQHNVLNIIDSPNKKLDIKFGIGVEQKTWDVPDVQKIGMGLTSGYDFFYIKQRWTFNSTVDYYGKKFPGINNGFINQMHQLSRAINPKFTVGIFFQLNNTNTRYLIDTLYNTDILKSNSQRVGITTGVTLGKHILGGRTGMMKLTNISKHELDNMYFIDLVYSYQHENGLSINYTAQNAYDPNGDINHRSVFIHNSNGMFRYKNIGLVGNYTRTPNFVYEARGQVLKNYIETLTGGPSINFNLFRNRVSGNIQYTVAKSVNDDVTRTAIGGYIGYTNFKTRTSLRLSGNRPLQQYTGSSYIPINEGRLMSLSLIQPLDIPILTQRKFSTLKLLVFHDRNGNGVKDKNERPLEGVRIDIKKQPLYTNKHGNIRFVNIPKAGYDIDFSAVNSEGLVPSNGLEQSVELNHNTSVAIPYKKGKAITGKVTVIRDSFSNTILTPDNLKIIATDSKGRSVSILTDADGKYTFYLPSEVFTISLNEEAFKGSDFKPESLSYEVDLNEKESEEVNFVIRQKARKVRFLKQ